MKIDFDAIRWRFLIACFLLLFFVIGAFRFTVKKIKSIKHHHNISKRLISIVLFLVLISLAAKQAVASVLMGVAFATLGAIISMTIITGGVATLTNYQQGIYARNGMGSGQAAGSTVITQDGNIGRAATVQWIDARDIDTATGAPRVKQKDVTLKVSTQKLMDAAKSNPSKYPKLSAAASTLPSNSPQTSYTLNGQIYVPYAIGEHLAPTREPYKTDWANYAANHTLLPCSTSYASGGYTVLVGSNGAYDEWKLAVAAVAPPPAVTTLAQFSQNLAKRSAALTSPAGVYSDYYGEIDDYLTGNSGSFSVVESSDPNQVSTSPSATLPTPATQSGVNTAIAQQGALGAAQNAVNTAQGNYNSNPSAENAQRLADAQRELARIIQDIAERNHDRDHDGDGVDDDEEAEDTGGFDPEKYGDRTDEDLNIGTRFQTFFDQMKTTALFSLPNQFLTGLPSGGSSTMSFNGGRFGQHTFDFAVLSSLWLSLRGLVLVVFGWYSIKIAALKGG